MSPEEKAARAATIRVLLADASVQSGFRAIEEDLFEEWKRSFKPEERENLWRAINVMERLKEWLHSNSSGDLTALRRVK